MHVTAWLIGDDAVHHMRALTAPKDRPPVEQWLPLLSEEESGDDLDGYRSAFAYRVGPRGEQWVDFAVPPPVVTAALGPHALAPPETLAMGSAPATALREVGEQLLVGVPRFFTTFTSAWTYEMVGRAPLITRGGEPVGRVAAGDLAIAESFRRFFEEPALIVDSDGPRLHDRLSGGYVNVGGLTRTDDVMAEIAALPPDARITCVWCEFQELGVHFNGYVFSDEPGPLMDSLIHVDGHPPGDVWLPLDVASDRLRSGWIAVQPQDRQPEAPRPSTGDEWVNCVWPTAFLRERLGPLALLGGGALTSRGVCRRNVRRIDGNWFAAVPRFSDTIGDHWSFQFDSEHSALVTLRGEATWTTTVRELDLAASLDLGAPALVAGPEGPVFYDVSFMPEEPGAYRARVAAAAAPLMDLPPDTHVWAVDWHE